MCLRLLVAIILYIFCYNLCDSSQVTAKWKRMKNNQVRQSPINIITADAVEAPLPNLHFIFNEGTNETVFIENNGHTIKLTTNLVHTLSGGPLTQDYVFEEMHFHWGGSEHMIDDIAFDMEIHFVFFKKILKTFKLAMKNPNGLAVVAMLVTFDEISPGDEERSTSDIFSEIERVAKFTGKFVLPDDLLYDFDLETWIPTDMDYFTYEGSLTTPPYSENVKWIIFHDPDIRLRPLTFPFKSSLRPIQLIGDRSVYLVRNIHKPI